MSTVKSSTFVALTTVARLPRARAPGSSRRVIEATTSSAVKALPLWNFTPLRSSKRHVSGATVFQLVASAGSSSILRLRRTSGSKTWWSMLVVKLSTCA